jgi:hypothetical protein
MLQHAQQGLTHQAGPAAGRYAFKSCSRLRTSHLRHGVTAKAGRITDAGTYTVRGTVRKQNEDRFDLQVTAVHDTYNVLSCAVTSFRVPCNALDTSLVLHADRMEQWHQCCRSRV